MISYNRVVSFILALGIALVLGIALAACSRPAPTPTPTPVPPTPTIALPTATPTATPVPATPTSTPLPPTPTPVVNPDVLPLLKADQVVIPGDWFTFYSSSDHFHLAYPPDWLAMDLSQKEWKILLNRVQDEQLRQLLTAQIKRLIATHTAAFITSPISESDAGALPFVSNLNIVHTSIPRGTSQKVFAQAVIQNLKLINGLRLETMNRGKIGAYPAIAVLYSYPIRGSDGRTYPVAGWQVYLRTASDNVFVLTFTTLADAFPKRITDFARMANSFRVVGGQ